MSQIEHFSLSGNNLQLTLVPGAEVTSVPVVARLGIFQVGFQLSADGKTRTGLLWGVILELAHLARQALRREEMTIDLAPSGLPGVSGWALQDRLVTK